MAKRDVRPRERLEAGVEAVGPGERAAQLRAEALEAVLGERVEQRLLAGEVAARGGVADADLARELAQRQVAALGRACARPASSSAARRLPWW